MDPRFRQLFALVEEQRTQMEQLRANHDALYSAMYAVLRGEQKLSLPRSNSPVKVAAGMPTSTVEASWDQPVDNAVWKAGDRGSMIPFAKPPRLPSPERIAGAPRDRSPENSPQRHSRGKRIFPENTDHLFLRSLSGRVLKLVQLAIDQGMGLGDLEIMDDVGWAQLGAAQIEQQAILRSLQEHCRRLRMPENPRFAMEQDASYYYEGNENGMRGQSQPRRGDFRNGYQTYTQDDQDYQYIQDDQDNGRGYQQGSLRGKNVGFNRQETAEIMAKAQQGRRMEPLGGQDRNGPAAIKADPVMYAVEPYMEGATFSPEPGKLAPPFYTYDQLNNLQKDVLLQRARDLRDFLNLGEKHNIPAQRDQVVMWIIKHQAQYTGTKPMDFGAPSGPGGQYPARSASPNKFLEQVNEEVNRREFVTQKTDYYGTHYVNQTAQV